MKIKIQYCLLLLLLSSIVYSCKSKKFTTEDMYGTFQQYSHFYWGLYKAKDNIQYELKPDSTGTAIGCNSVALKWYVDGGYVFLLDSTSSRVVHQYRIKNKKLFKGKRYRPLIEKSDTSFYLQPRKHVYKKM